MLIGQKICATAVIAACALAPTLCLGLGEQRFVGFSQLKGGISLVDAPIVIDKADFKGVQIAAQSLSDDFDRVTGKAAKIQYSAANGTQVNAATAIIVGSIGSSSIIKGLVQAGKINVTDVEGKWESFVTAVVDKPIGGIGKALVIVGSDKRGAIFGIYTLSEQIGVSPLVSLPPSTLRKCKKKGLISENKILVGTGGRMLFHRKEKRSTHYLSEPIMENPASGTGEYSSTTKHPPSHPLSWRNSAQSIMLNSTSMCSSYFYV